MVDSLKRAPLAGNRRQPIRGYCARGELCVAIPQQRTCLLRSFEAHLGHPEWRLERGDCQHNKISFPTISLLEKLPLIYVGGQWPAAAWPIAASA
jgi:hypothetical protein